MGSKLKNIGLISLGLIAGIGSSIQFDAIAQKSVSAPLPRRFFRRATMCLLRCASNIPSGTA